MVNVRHKPSRFLRVTGSGLNIVGNRDYDCNPFILSVIYLQSLDILCTITLSRESVENICFRPVVFYISGLFSYSSLRFYLFSYEFVSLLGCPYTFTGWPRKFGVGPPNRFYQILLFMETPPSNITSIKRFCGKYVTVIFDWKNLISCQSILQGQHLGMWTPTRGSLIQ